MTLNELKENKKAKIIKINLNKNQIDRLISMGIYINTEVVLVKKAPLNNPIEIKIKNSNLALRVEDAIKIEVQYI